MKWPSLIVNYRKKVCVNKENSFGRIGFRDSKIGFIFVLKTCIEYELAAMLKSEK